MHLNHNRQKNVWEFETEQLRGFIQPEGERHGVKEILHKPTGIQVVHPLYDVFNLFFLFSTNLCLGQARLIERSIRAEDDLLEVHWPPVDHHKVALAAAYRVREPNIIDLTITVRAQWAYPAYEVFVSSYFDPRMQPHVFVAGSPFADPPDQPQWIAPVVNDVFVGTGLVFARDQHAARRSVDGRWDRIWATYQWNPQRYYARPLMCQTDPDNRVAAVLMSRPEDCYAVISGYNTDNLEDHFKDQNPLYLSLFGDDLVPGSERTVHARLVVTEPGESLTSLLPLHDAFLSEHESGMK